MNKKILGALTAMVLASPAMAVDTNVDTHNVTIQVPEVALIDVNDADVTFVCALQTHNDSIAGENFECNDTDGSTSDTVSSSYDITANVAVDAATGRTLTVKSTTPVDSSWKLVTNVAAPAASGATVANVQINNTEESVVTGIKNVAQSGLAMTYSLGPANANEAMAFSGDGTGVADTIAVTYTLGDD